MPGAKTTAVSESKSYRRTLTDATCNRRTGAWKLTHRDLKLGTTAKWSVRRRTLHGGRQEGVELIEVDNGALRFTVIPTRGMGVLCAELGDVRLAWDSPIQEVVHPQFMNLSARGGLGWLEGFNEFLVRCGLESFGPPGTDTFRTADGTESRTELTLHGRIANVPASAVEVVVDRTPPHRIRVRGRVDERMFLGAQFELWTEISTEPGSHTFRVEDSVRNGGGVAREFQLLYHVNYGSPLLEAGARFRAAVGEITPANAYSAKHVGQMEVYQPPTAGFAEQVYFMTLRPDRTGSNSVLLHNATGTRGVSMRFDSAALPCFTLWKHTGAIADGYVTGLEPGTSFPRFRQAEREAGRVPTLGAGESRRFVIDFTIHTDAVQVSEAAETVASAGRAAPTSTQ